MELRFGQLHPFFQHIVGIWSLVTREPNPAIPHIEAELTIGGVTQKLLLASSLDVDFLSPGEEPILTTHWRMVDDDYDAG